jgi:dihydrofolate reductase
MTTLIYSMSVSLDGYIAGPDGAIDWSAPDEELLRFKTEQTRELTGHQRPPGTQRRRGEVAELKNQPGVGRVGVGGAGLAASLAEKDLIDEYRLFICPVVLGGGTPFFPPLAKRLGLELIETQTFSQVVYLRYRRG